MATAVQKDIMETVREERIVEVERDRTVYEVTLSAEEAHYLLALLSGTYGDTGWRIFSALGDATNDVDYGYAGPVSHSGHNLKIS